MRKLIAIGGMPATGKTAILRQFMAPLVWERIQPRKLVTAMYNQEHDLIVLGDYSDPDQPFPGTDCLSMAVQPEAIRFLNETTSNVLFEGDRLFTGSFLEFAAILVDQSVLDLDIILVQADSLIVESRHEARNDGQNEQWLRSRQSKLDNIRGNFVLMDYITEFSNNNEGQLTDIVTYLRLQLLDKDGVVEID